MNAMVSEVWWRLVWTRTINDDISRGISLRRIRIFACFSKCSPPKIAHYCSGGKKSNCTTDKQNNLLMEKQYQSQVKRQQIQCASGCNFLRRVQYHFHSILPIDAIVEFNQEEIADRSKLRNILKNDWSVLFKNICYLRWKKTGELFQIKTD